MPAVNIVKEAPKIGTVIYHPRTWLCCQLQLSCLRNSTKGSSLMWAHYGNSTPPDHISATLRDNRRSPGSLRNFQRKTWKAPALRRLKIHWTLQEQPVIRYWKIWGKGLSEMIYSISKPNTNPWFRYHSLKTVKNPIEGWIRGFLSSRRRYPVFRWALCHLSQIHLTWICPYWPTKRMICHSVQSLNSQICRRGKSSHVQVPKQHHRKRISLGHKTWTLDA